MPKWLVWLVAPLVDKSMTRKMIAKNVGYPFLADHSKSVHELGINYRPFEESLTQFFQQLIDNGVV
jgi:dihydroflavonol-4-reductase